MGRTPDGATPRKQLVAVRFSDDERLRLKEQQVFRGAPNESAYLRRLIADDAKKIRRERGSK